MNAFTIVGRNYLAHARVLGESFRRTNPDAGFSVYLLDDDGSVDTSDEPFDLLHPEDVFSEEELQDLHAIYDVMELATAVKPRVLAYLLDANGGTVAYLDPDLWFFGSLDEASRRAEKHGVVLTPHAVDAVTRDGLRPTETELLKSGVYNLGFILVGEPGREFLDWWWERLERDCIVDPESGLFVDQRWVDYVPGLFDHYILRDPAYNIAYWNLGERTLTWTGEQYQVYGNPLVFAHFSGFDPNKPFLLSKHTGDTPRVRLSDQPALAKICDEYARAMLDAGYDEARKIEFEIETLPNGMKLDRPMRRVFRTALIASETGKAAPNEDPPPNPFRETEAFVAWLKEPAGPGYPPEITRYLLGMWRDRSDLQSAFPDIAGSSVGAYLYWFATQGEDGVPAYLIPPRALPGDDGTALPAPKTGINVVGYLRAEQGVGEAARKMVATVAAAGQNVSTFAYGSTQSRQEHEISDVLSVGVDEPPYDVNIVAVNADATVYFARDAGAEFFDRRYTVGMWAWEVEEFPATWDQAFNVIDEVWMNSAYAAEAVSAASTKPVFSVPLPVAVPPSQPIDKAELGLPDRFLFLFSFDFFSVFERKNPLGLIEAFTTAFEPGAGPILLVKSMNGEKRIPQLEELKAAAAAHPDVFVMDGYLTARQKDGLTATCDAYVSLHRSEGFGLTMAEAMALGKPTIATGYSGNLEFMTHENSYLVGYELGEVPPGCDPYPIGSTWAEPDIDDAARLMQHVHEHQEEATARGTRAKRDIEEKHSPEARSVLVAEHLRRIRHKKENWGRRSGAGLVTGGFGLAQAREAVERPVANLWEGSAARGLGGRVRSAALAVMRPALARERAVDEMLLGALEQLAAHMAQLQSRVLEVRVGQAEIGDMAETVRKLTTDVKAAAGGAQAFRNDASEHLSQLSAAVADLEQAAKLLRADLQAPPYMADDAGLRLKDGRLGFAATSGTGDAYRDFEDAFRGTEHFIKDRQRRYLELLADYGPVLDAGCGRGEFLDLAREAGVETMGVDLDEGMVERCRAKGHTVEHGDVVDYLAGLEDGSLGAVFSAQFVEHISLDHLIEFQGLAVRKLRSGGLYVAETVNPHSFPAFRTFWTDLTHRVPIYPEVLLTLVRSAGFASAEVIFPNGTGDEAVDLHTQGEYAVVARVG